MVKKLFIAALLTATGLTARNVKTSRTLDPQSASDTVRTDTITPGPADVTLSGYDKPQRTTRETFFMTNGTSHHILRAVISISYFDTDSLLLHSRSVTVSTDIPAGETRSVSIPSWDRQQSFRYVGSRRSRTPAIPYFVRQSVDTIFTAPEGR